MKQTQPWHSPFDDPVIDEKYEKIADAFIKQCNSERIKHLEIFSAAYFKITNLDPNDAILIEEQIDNMITWRFEPKNKLIFNFLI